MTTKVQGQWPITLQWYRNGDPMPGETNAHLTSVAAGNYELRASNALGVSVSETAVVQFSDGTALTYASWAAERGLASDSQFEDYNGDGQLNIFDYALVGAPQLVRSDAGTWDYQLTRRKTDDVPLGLQQSVDLRTWTEVPDANLTIEQQEKAHELLQWSLSGSAQFLRIVAGP